MNAKTLEIIETIKNDPSDRMIVATYAWAFNDRRYVTSAFKAAVKQGIIRVAYKSMQGNNVYERVLTGPAMVSGADAPNATNMMIQR